MTPKFCKNNGILWRRIGIFAIILIILLIVLISYLIFSSAGRGSCDNSCISENCLEAVKELAENADQEVDPCQNFYSFSCGKWMERYENESFSMTGQMKLTMQLSIKEVLSGLERNSSTKSGKLKIVYDSCMDYGASELNAVPSILNFFKLLGMEEWPNLPNDFNFSSPSLEESIGILMGYNEFPFIKIKRGKENKKKLNDILISAKDGQMDVDDMDRTLYKITNYFRASPYNANNIVKDYLLLSNEVLTMLPKGTCVENCNFQTVDIKCSSRPERHVKLICDIAQYVVRYNGLEKTFSTDHLVLDNASPVLVLYSLQNFYTHRQLANYFALSFLLNHLPTLDSYLRYLKFGMKEKWIVCTNWMTKAMTQPLAQIYFSKKVPVHKLKEVHTIVEAYKDEADGLINQQPWLDEKMKRKLSNNLFNLGTSHLVWMKYLADGTFDGLMNGYHPTNSSFLWNVLDYQKQQFNFYLLNEIPSSAENVFRIFERNEQHSRGLVDLLFGILVPPAYDPGRPRWMNYASLGFVVAHEIGHEIIFSFKESDVPEEALEKLNSTATCLIDQYSNFSLEESGKKRSSQMRMTPNKSVFRWYAEKFHDLFVNGTLTFEENLADLIAMELVEKLVHKLQDDFSPTCVPEFPYSTKQLYYILLTQLWCETDILEMNLEDKYSASRYRMTGVIQNAKDFSEAYKCEDFSHMNPQIKCNFFD